MDHHARPAGHSPRTDEDVRSAKPTTVGPGVLAVVPPDKVYKKCQELNRENFNLKLRIYYLEGQDSVDSKDVSSRPGRSPRHPSQQTPHRSTSATPASSRPLGVAEVVDPGNNSPSGRNNGASGTLDDQLQQCRKDNEDLRRRLRRYETAEPQPGSPPSGERSSGSAELRDQLEACKRREKKLLEEIESLKRANGEADRHVQDLQERHRQQLEALQKENQQLQKQLKRSESVFKNMTLEYNARIAELKRHPAAGNAEGDKHRHEYEQTDSSASPDGHVAEIKHLESMIEKLREDLRRSPPATPKSSGTGSAENKALRDALARVSAECAQLRQGEVDLRQQIDRISESLGIQPKTGSGTIAPTGRVDDPQEIVSQTVISLRNDTDNVAQLRSRVEQLIRDSKTPERPPVEPSRADHRECESRIESLKDELARCEAELAEKRREIERLKNENRGAQPQPDAPKAPYEPRPPGDDSALRARILELENEIKEYRVGRQNLEDIMEKERGLHQQRFGDLQSAFERQMDECEHRLTLSQTEVERLNRLLNDHRSDSGSQTANAELQAARDTIARITNENQRMKQEQEEFEIRIRLEIEQEYENEYRLKESRRDSEIQNFQREKETLISELRQAKVERLGIEQRVADLNMDVRQANQTIEEKNREIQHFADGQRGSNGKEYREGISQYVEEIKQCTVEIENLRREVIFWKNKYQDATEKSRPSVVVSQDNGNYSSTRIPRPIPKPHDPYQSGSRGSNDSALIDRLHTEIRDKEILVERLQRDLTSVSKEAEERELKFRIYVERSEQNSATYQTLNKSIALENCEHDLSSLRAKLTHTQEQFTWLQQENSDLKEQLKMVKLKIHSATSEVHEHYRLVVHELEAKLHERVEYVQSLEHSLRECEDKLGESYRTPIDSAITANNQTWTSRTITEKITISNGEKENYMAELGTKDLEISELKRKLEQGTTWSSEVERKDQEIVRLKREIEQLRQSKTSTYGRSPGTVNVNVRLRRNYDSLTRDDLLFELENAYGEIDTLTKGLEQRFPSTTEIHKQLCEVRNELTRQKYVNQVLWRKLDALMDIHGSNTRAELAIELANYQDELAKLKMNQSRPVDAAPIRSSSEQNLSTAHHGLSPSKNIKSTVALLERSNIEWQAKLARLTEQLGRSESQSRNAHRELTKLQKLLHDAGLVEAACTRPRRRSADDSCLVVPSESPLPDEELDQIRDPTELKEIIVNQRKFIQQLQLRIRVNTPDLIQLPNMEKLAKQNQDFKLVINTYENESALIQSELKKLYETVEHDRTTLQQYEALIKEQQIQVEKLKKKLRRYEQWVKKADLHLPLFDEPKSPMVDSLEEYIIELEMDGGEDTAKSSDARTVQTPGGSSTTIDLRGYQQQLSERDQEILRLKDEIAEYRRTRKHSGHNDSGLINEAARHEARIKIYQERIEDLERRIPSHISKTGNGSSGQIESSQLVEEMRRLHRELELNMTRQDQLQLRLEENIRESRAPRTFTFSGHGSSQVDLRVTDEFSKTSTTNVMHSGTMHERRSRSAGLSSTELDATDYRQQSTGRTSRLQRYVVGDVNDHDKLRRKIQDIKFDYKEIASGIASDVRSRQVATLGDGSRRSLDGAFAVLDQSLIDALDLIERYWRTELPERNEANEHSFVDNDLVEQSRRVLLVQQDNILTIHRLTEKCKDQAKQIEQLLAQLTKANRKKADTGDYLALLLRPTLDVLQKARSNIEHHIKETNELPPGSAQSRRHRTNRHD